MKLKGGLGECTASSGSLQREAARASGAASLLRGPSPCPLSQALLVTWPAPPGRLPGGLPLCSSPFGGEQTWPLGDPLAPSCTRGIEIPACWAPVEQFLCRRAVPGSLAAAPTVGVSHTGGACPGASALPGLCCCCRSLPLFAGFLLVKPWATRGERSPRQAALRGCGWVPAARSCPRSAPRARLSPARPRVLLSPSRARRDRGFAASPSPAHEGVPARKRRQRHHASPNAPRAPLWVWVVWGVPSILLPAIVPEILFPGSP